MSTREKEGKERKERSEIALRDKKRTRTRQWRGKIPVFIHLTCIIRCDKSVEDERSKVEFVIKLGAESLDLASQLQKVEKQ